MLPEPLLSLWNQYLHEERSGVRRTALTRLDAFIAALLQEPSTVWTEWARALAAASADDSLDVPVRMPLFRQVFLPALTAGVRHGEPGAARTLACFGHLLVHGLPTDLPPALEARAGLLREAVRVDPGDVRALNLLVEDEARYFTFTLHELPSGVLYGMNGATCEQCAELLCAVDAFDELTRRIPGGARYGALIRECRFHYAHYAQYLNQRSAGSTYAAFLAAHD